MPKISVSLCDILQYVGDRNRPLKEGEAVFKAGHIILCGLDGDMVRSLCLQTSSLTSQPHEISLKLHQDVKQWKFVCSCKAGMSGFCKHIVATIIYINRSVTYFKSIFNSYFCTKAYKCYTCDQKSTCFKSSCR